jgi:YggT family protein
MQVRQDIADFLGALLTVYTLCIFAYIVMSLVFSFGLRMPYSRPLNAVMDFVRDVSEPLLRIFRRLPLQIGPIDLSPIVAIFVLGIVGRLVISAVSPS